MAVEIKKTMVDALAFVTTHGNMSKENLAKFTEDFCVKKAGGNGDSKPREATKLYDAEGTLLGGRCSATLLWFGLEDYNHHHGLSKQAQNAKGRLNTKAKEIEAGAAELLVEARDITDPSEKLAKFEEYDEKMAEAKEVRDTAITVKDFTEEVETYESVEALAEALGVEVITTKPKAEMAETEKSE